MDEFVGEDGELFVDPRSRDSSPENDDLGADRSLDRAPAPAQGGKYGSASTPRRRLLGKGQIGVRDGELSRDRRSRNSLPENSFLGADRSLDRAPAPAHGGKYGSASTPGKRLLAKGRISVRDGELSRYRRSHDSSPENSFLGADRSLDRAPAPAHGGKQGDGREYLDGSTDTGVNLETGGGPRKRKWSSGLTEQPGPCGGPEKQLDKRSKVGRRLWWEERSSSTGEGLDGGEEEQGTEAKEQLFGSGRKNHPPSVDSDIIKLLARFEEAHLRDAALNEETRTDPNKLLKLPHLISALSMKNLQKPFLDHDVLAILKNWLKPYPDGSLPILDIRIALLKLLNELPIDLKQLKRREQLKRSGVAEVIVALSRSLEETPANRKLAKELVDKWSRTVKGTEFGEISDSYKTHKNRLKGDH